MADFMKEADLAVTVSDAEGNVVYQNDRSQKTFGDAVGRNLMGCHNLSSSREKIAEMMRDGSSNVYTVERGGVRKLIYQTPWREDGRVGGLVEFSIVLPAEIPHKVR